MKRTKRWIPLLCTVLLATLLLGAMPAHAEALDLSRKLTISYYHNGAGQGRYPDEQDVILKVLNEKFNMDLQLNVIESEYVSKLNLQVASGNVPDIMQVTAAQFSEFLAQDLLLPIEDYVERMPNFMATYPDVLEDETLRVDGHLYFLAGNRPPEGVVKSYYSLWVRQDWLDNLGLAVPTTLEEVKEVAVAFAQQDPDGNGQNDTFGYTGMGAAAGSLNALNPLLGAFGVGMNDYILQDGKLVYCAATPEYENALAWIGDFIDTGAVDPDMMLMDTFDQVREKVYRNQVGMIYMSWAEFVKPPYDEMLAEMTPDAQWVQIEAPVGPGGSFDSVYNIPGAKNSGRVLSAELANDPEKLARVLAYLDYIVAGEGERLVCYGVEGEHYTMEDGVITPTDRMGEVSYAWQHQVMGRNEPVYLATKFPTCQAEIGFAADLPRIDGYSNYVGIPEGRNKADLQRYVTEETTRFIYGKRDLATFDEYVSVLMGTYGLQDYIDLGIDTMNQAGIAAQ